jgi:hypothetical protein
VRFACARPDCSRLSDDRARQRRSRCGQPRPSSVTRPRPSRSRTSRRVWPNWNGLLVLEGSPMRIRTRAGLLTHLERRSYRNRGSGMGRIRGGSRARSGLARTVGPRGAAAPRCHVRGALSQNRRRPPSFSGPAGAGGPGNEIATDIRTWTKPLARQKSAAILLCQDDCKAADPAVTSLRDALVRSAQQGDRIPARTRNTNPHKSNRPAQVGRLPPRCRIGNAPGSALPLFLSRIAPAHSRYNRNDITRPKRARIHERRPQEA